MHFEGLFKMLSPGRLEAQPGPGTVRIGKPIAVPAGLPRLEAARLMRDAVADLSGDPER
jgi:hypothetical protein